MHKELLDRDLEAFNNSSHVEPEPTHSQWYVWFFDTTRKAIFITVFILTTFFTSTIACSWITDAISNHRQRAAFSMDLANEILIETNFAYTLCMEMSAQNTFGNIVDQWEEEKSRYMNHVQAKRESIDRIMRESLQCKKEMKIAQGNMETFSEPFSCTVSDQIQLEATNNAWVIQQPREEIWRYLRLWSSPNGKVSDQLTIMNDARKQFTYEKMKSSVEAIKDIANMGSRDISKRLADTTQLIQSIEESSSWLALSSGEPMSLKKSLQSTKSYLKQMKEAMAIVQPLVGVAVPSLQSGADVDFNIESMIQMEETWSKKFKKINTLMKDAQVIVDQWHEATIENANQATKSIESIANSNINTTKPSYATLTIRSILLGQIQHPNDNDLFQLNLGNLGFPNGSEWSQQPKIRGWDIQVEGSYTEVPIDLIIRIITCVIMIILVFYGEYMDVPEMDNQGFTTLHTTADWFGIFCCRHRLSDILHSVATLNIWPFLWTSLLCVILFMATWGLLIPINRGHSLACSNQTLIQSNMWLGSAFLNLATTYVQERGNSIATEGIYQMKNIHDRSCMVLERNLLVEGAGYDVNMTKLLLEYELAYSTLELYKKCTNFRSNSTFCSMHPEVLRELNIPSRWSCPSLNRTIEDIKRPCSSTIVQDFKAGSGHVQVCLFERMLLEYVSMTWVWIILFSMLNLMRCAFLKALAIFLWRTLCGGRMPFRGFVDSSGDVLDQGRLHYRFDRHLKEYRWQQGFYCILALLAIAFGSHLIVATLANLY